MTDPLDEIGLLDDEDIELDLAALTLSALDHEGLDLAPARELLSGIADRLAALGADCHDPGARAGALASVLAGEFGFAGDAQAYGAPVNADLVRVLERRQGLPVSLSILYVAAARRVGWAAYALNTPGHVLVRVGDHPFTLIDPFNGGAPVSQDDLAGIVRLYMGPEATVLPEYLRPVPNRAVLVRLLRNQASRAEQEGDFDRAIALCARMTRFAPEYPDVWWELARLQIGQGNPGGARDSLSALLEVTREPGQRQAVVELLRKLDIRENR